MNKFLGWAMTGLVGMACSGAALAAPAVPEPGESLPPAAPGEPKTEYDTPVPQAPATHLRFTLKSITVEQPDTDCQDAALASIAQKATGHEITVSDLDATLTELSVYCRSHGYPAAFAFVPEQKVRDGHLIIRIDPGRYGRITIDNQAKASDAKRVAGLIAGLKSGDIIKNKPLEMVLYNASELHGLNVTGVLTPGESEGTSDLTVRIVPGKKATATVYAENYGSRSSGRYRYGLQASLLGLGNTGGRLTVGTLHSNHDLHNYNVGLDLPVGHSATTLGISYSRMDYELGDLYRALGAEGVANTLSVYGSTPLWRTAKSSLLVTYGYDYRRLTDEMREFDISIKKHSHAFHLGLDGTLRWGGDALHYNLTALTGELSPDSEWGRELGEAGETLGHYTKGTLDLTGLKTINRDFDVLLKLSGQLASRNLDSSEQIYLGGAHGVRAYPQGDGSGDKGLLGTLELRYHTPLRGLTLSTYFDAGHIRRAKDGSAGSDTLKGWGLGLTYSDHNDWFARLDYARRIGTPHYLSTDAESRQRTWFLVGKTF